MLYVFKMIKKETSLVKRNRLTFFFYYVCFYIIIIFTTFESKLANQTMKVIETNYSKEIQRDDG